MLGMFRKKLTGLCQCNAPGGAFEEWCSQFLFQGGNLVCDGWLGNVKLLGSLCEIFVVCNSHKVA